MKKAKCITIDVSLLAEAEKEVMRKGITFSALVEEALKLYLSVGRLEEKLTIIETLLRRCLEEARREPPQTPAEVQKPPQQRTLSNNIWVEILRRR